MLKKVSSMRGWQLAIAFLCLVSVACGPDLPRIPAVDELGFEAAFDDIREQVQTAYEQWERAPRDPERNGYLGMLLSAYGKNAAAELLFRRARILAPEEFRWAYYRAISLGQLGEYAEAANMFRAALEIDPDYVAARVQLAAMLLQSNAADESAALYREITISHPARIDGWLGLGKALHRSGDLAGAVAALKRARIVGPQYGEVHYALASALAANGNAQAAADEYAAYERTARNRIHMGDPLIQDIRAINASDGPHMANADYFLRNGRFDEAVVAFRNALSVNPANQDAWAGLVNTHARRDDMSAAGKAYREALEAGIEYPRLHLTYGQALLSRQDFDGAREAVARAIALDPQYAVALTVMGELEMQRGTGAAAAGFYEQALAVRPNDRDIAISLARALNAAGQYGDAADRLAPLIGDPAVDQSIVLKALAVAYRGQGRNAEAVDTLQRARKAARGAANNAMVGRIDALLAQWQGTT